MSHVQLDKEMNESPYNLKRLSVPMARPHRKAVLESSNFQVPLLFLSGGPVFLAKRQAIFLYFSNMLCRHGSFSVPYSGQRDFIRSVASVRKSEKE